MDYVSPEEARDMTGLRLALTRGVPGPWSMAAKSIFDVKDIDYMAVEQVGAAPNDALFEWTGHRNAPVAVYNDERPRVGWQEIVMLAERLKPEPALVPDDIEDRMAMWGLMTEIASEGGFAWQRRLGMLAGMTAADDERTKAAGEIMSKRYGFTAEAAAAAERRIVEILKMLAARLNEQKSKGSDYFIGNGLTAADLYWAAFAALVDPLPEEVNPMPKGLRAAYETTGPAVAKAVDPVLLAHRDMVYERHLSLPLEF